MTSPFFSITLIFFAFFPRLYKMWEIHKEIQLLPSGPVVISPLSQMWDSSSSILDTLMASASTVFINYLSYLITCVYVLYILSLYHVVRGLLGEKRISLKSPRIH